MQQHVGPSLNDEVLIDLIPSRVDALVANLDRRIGAQLDEILHHPAFQQMERAWRGLALVIERADFHENIQIDLLDCSKDALREDFEEARRPTDGGLVKIAYTRAVGAGNEPYGALIADYAFGPDPADVRLLQYCAIVGSLAVAPFIAAASPAFFGVTRAEDIHRVPSLREAIERSTSRRWDRFRETEEARAVGLTVSRFLLRAPHAQREGEGASFDYTESMADREHLCWGHGSFALATRLTDSFAKHRWCPNIIGPAGGGMLEGLPDVPGEGATPVDAVFTGELERAVAQEGLIALVGLPGGRACFYSACSAQKPKYYGETEEGRAAGLTSRLGTRLPYFLMIGRVVQYLKVVYRSYQHTYESHADAERELNDWLGQYVSASGPADAAFLGQRPLRRARVRIREAESWAEWRQLDFKLRPHFKHRGAFYTLTCENRLETTKPGVR